MYSRKGGSLDVVCSSRAKEERFNIEATTQCLVRGEPSGKIGRRHRDLWKAKWVPWATPECLLMMISECSLMRSEC